MADEKINDGNLVDHGAACPLCGERDCDKLVIQSDEETVECQSCGNFYKLD